MSQEKIMNPIKSFRKSFKIKFLIVTRNGINGFIVCIEGTFPQYQLIDPNSIIDYPTLNCTLFASGTPFIYYRGVWRKCRATSNRQIDSITIKSNRFKCILYCIFPIKHFLQKETLLTSIRELTKSGKMVEDFKIHDKEHC